MGDWKSSAIGGSMQKYEKRCVKMYLSPLLQGGAKNRSYQSDIYMVCFYVILCGVREQGCFAHRVFIRVVV